MRELTPAEKQDLLPAELLQYIFAEALDKHSDDHKEPANDSEDKPLTREPLLQLI